jgi:hypothetical protein
MANAVTTHMARTYVQEAPAPMALSSLFTSDARNYYSSEKIEFDIEREGEEIAPVLTDIKNGNTKFALDEYTNKEFLAPVIKEEFTLNAFDMIKRQAGQISFTDPVFRANAMTQFMKHMRYGGKRQRRTIELMAAQILQTGTVTLKDDKGADVYKIDFKPKATHFPTSATAWTDAANCTPVQDLESLADAIHTDGQSMPDRAIFGKAAWQNFIRSDEVKSLMDNRRITIGGVDPETPRPGLRYMGYIDLTGYRLNLYTYKGEYKDIGASVNSRYVEDNNVIVLSENMRLDATWGAIPQIVPPETRAMSFLSGRMAMASVGMDFTTNAWVSLNGESITGSLGSRPLLIPTSIDRFGCLTTA